MIRSTFKAFVCIASLALAGCAITTPIGTVSLGTNGITASVNPPGTPVTTTTSGGSTTTTIGSTTGGSTATAPADTNAYPFAQAASGLVTEDGTGPNRLEVDITGNPSNCSVISVAILVNSKVVAAPIITRSCVGTTLTGDDVVIIHGVFPAGSTVQINGISPNGINSAWIENVSIDYVQLVTNNCLDSRAACNAQGLNCAAGGCNVNAPAVFVSNGANVTFGPPVTTVGTATGTGGAATTAVLSNFTAQVNGTASTGTLATIIAGMPSGADVVLPAQTIVGTTTVPVAGTIEGAGEGKTIIDLTGVPLAYGKGGFVPLVTGTVYKNMTIKGCAVSDANGAAVRQNGDGIDFKLDTVEITGCQDGLLTFSPPPGGKLLIVNSNIHDNGAGDGRSHSIYASTGGTGAAQATLDIENTVVANDNGAHEVKSREGTTLLVDDTITTGGEGSCLDQPDSGNATISGGSCTLKPGSDDHVALNWAMESVLNGAGGTLHITKDAAGNPWVVNGNGVGPMIETTDPTAILIFDDGACKYVGLPLDLSNWKGTVQGACQAA